jgi:hypothetical protein
VYDLLGLVSDAELEGRDGDDVEDDGGGEEGPCGDDHDGVDLQDVILHQIIYTRLI